jgi:uncharacterized protein YijF (DUF1287 family)
MKAASKFFRLSCTAAILLVAACEPAPSTGGRAPARPATAPSPVAVPDAPRVNRDWTSASIPFGLRLSAAAEERATHQVIYDAAYVQIPYPNGDVAPDRGVCSDEVVRAYRLLGIDLQRLVHEDMRRAFNAYPNKWGLGRPDPNIDHRRVPNLAMFFKRQGASLPVSSRGLDYKPGDVVAFALPDGRPHIGLITERLSDDGERPLVLHNIGRGPQIEDMLFTLTITGRFHYTGPQGR